VFQPLGQGFPVSGERNARSSECCRDHRNPQLLAQYASQRSFVDDQADVSQLSKQESAFLLDFFTVSGLATIPER
jgi:hypothetical protein